MGSNAKYHHLIPQTYMSAWANSSGTLKYKELATDYIGTKNKDNLCGINHYHSIVAGMPICTESDANTIFAIMRDYKVVYEGKEITSNLELNQIYYDFGSWEITRKVDGTVASKKPIRAAIDQVKIRDIEENWSIKYENNWPNLRSAIENNVLKASGEIPEFDKEYLMKFFISIDWRSIASEQLFTEQFQWLGIDVLSMNEVEIPEEERELPFFETMADYFKHCLLLKLYRRFLNDEGPIYDHVQQSLMHTSFHFLVADGPTHFITSDNPSFVYWREDGNKAGIMPITPRILLAQGRKTDMDPVYCVTHITDEAVQRYNTIIENNADKYVIYDNSKN